MSYDGPATSHIPTGERKQFSVRVLKGTISKTFQRRSHRDGEQIDREVHVYQNPRKGWDFTWIRCCSLCHGFCFDIRISHIDIRGLDDISTNDQSSNGPWTYLGMVITGFPNIISLYGPQVPTAFSSNGSSSYSPYVERHMQKWTYHQGRS